MRILAIDYGSKGIGIAISDELQMMARPLTTIRRERMKMSEIYDRISSLVQENQAGELVVGMPLNMDGSRGDAAISVEKFISKLKEKMEIPVFAVDERLTSHEADQILREMGVGEKERRARSDEYAAMIILQDFLDQKSRQAGK
ncbi:MAG: Holliday junction resolvase RuvX [Acidobacteria bacterium]|nr:Holliday junction resolvase RuvX [Acidobacteriota bacterium]MBK8315227.1 Holliday junction resolvase RuvX [Acidobacteriota bacterium]